MSYTEIYKFNKRGKAQILAEVKNAMRGALMVWDILEKKYLPPAQIPRFISGNLNEVWELVADPRLSTEERICLLCTLDAATVKKEYLPDLVRCFRSFGGNTNLSEQAAAIEAMLNSSEMDDVIAIAFNQTSANADTWDNNFGVKVNGREVSYNILKMNDHFDVYEQLKLN